MGEVTPGDTCVYMFARTYAWMDAKSYPMAASDLFSSSTFLRGPKWHLLRLDKHKQFLHALEGKILVYMSNITVEFWG